MTSIVIGDRDDCFFIRNGDVAYKIDRSHPYAVQSSSEDPSANERSLQVKAVFGTLVDADGGRHLVICRAAEKVADLNQEAPFYRITDADLLPYSSSTDPQSSKLLSNVKSMLSSGCFYFSDSPVLLNPLTEKQGDRTEFNWGQFMAQNFSNQPCPLINPLMQGFIGQRNLEVKQGMECVVTLFGRRSRLRGGLRFHHRGVDDDGATANFVESEIIVQYRDGKSKGIFSYLQIRGSVPVFWRQRSGSGPEIARRKSMSEAGFFRHEVKLRQNWTLSDSGENTTKRDTKRDTTSATVVMLDLLSRTKDTEARLAREFQSLASHGNSGGVVYIPFDFNKHVTTSLKKGIKPLLKSIHPYLIGCGWNESISQRSVHESVPESAESQATLNNTFSKRQHGIIRTNCLDCLDRTNAAQMILAWQALRESKLASFIDDLIVRSNDVNNQPNYGPNAGSTNDGSDVMNHINDAQPSFDGESQFLSSVASTFSDLWILHGDEISKIYTGSASVLSRFLRNSDLDCRHLSDRRSVQDSANHPSDSSSSSSHPHQQQSQQQIAHSVSAPVLVASSLEGAWRSAERLYSHHFEGEAKQQAMDMILYSPNSGPNDNSQSHPSGQQTFQEDVETNDALYYRGSSADEMSESSSSVKEATSHHTTLVQNVETTSHDLSVWMMTYNVAGKEVWHFSDFIKSLKPADIVCVAIQEIVNLDFGSFLFPERNGERGVELECAILDALNNRNQTSSSSSLSKTPSEHAKTNYVVVDSMCMVGLYMIVLVKSQYKHHISEIITRNVKTGIVGGNKGAVSVSFRLGIRNKQNIRQYTQRRSSVGSDDASEFSGSEDESINHSGKTFCFVNVHLDSGIAKTEERVNQLAVIMDQLFYKPGNTYSNFSSRDFVALLGDFNFRIHRLDSETIMQKINSNQLHEILKFDELRSGMFINQLLDSADLHAREKLHAHLISRQKLEMHANMHANMHAGGFEVPLGHLVFQEAPINFPPTYKLIPCETRKSPIALEYAETRVPAWCDRILISGGELVSYSSLLNLNLSDHKPVTCELNVRGIFFDPVSQRHSKMIDAKSRKNEHEDGWIVVKHASSTDISSLATNTQTHAGHKDSSTDQPMDESNEMSSRKNEDEKRFPDHLGIVDLLS